MRASVLKRGYGLEFEAARAYPERVEHESGWHDRLADWLTTRLVRPLTERVRDPARSLAAILPPVRACEGEFANASDARLRAAADALRPRLSREGITPELAGRAFALVREVAQRRIGQRHFDVQLMGGWALTQGRLVEMHTGEGKTLTATLAAATAALAGMPAHVITVNDYLASRDAQAMGPVYEALGLTVGVVVQGMPRDARRAAYACDVTYCTNKDLAFDYLRDRVALGRSGGPAHLALEGLKGGASRADRALLRGLHFGIVDEADSIFIDEARTPLILSGMSGDVEDARTCAQALDLARSLDEGRDYKVARRERAIDLEDAGRERLAALCESLEGPWKSARAREEHVRQALSAIHLFRLGEQYVISEGKVRIVDEFTGRIMPDRSWERGLHQMIEAKEGVEITGRHETLARITYQRLFRRYLLLAGMTGTGREVAAEAWSTYRLPFVEVPLNRPSQRRVLPGRLVASARAKWEAVADAVERCARDEQRPVLVGTRSVRASEELSRVLEQRGLTHALLNALQDKAEAQVVAAAGGEARITVATNMAGRGTDIRLGRGVAERGGLHVILTEFHESARIDRQLFGRASRQGDPGSCEAIVSLDDELFLTYAPWVTRLVSRYGHGDTRPGWQMRLLRAVAQSAAERRNRRIRADTLRQDRALEKTLAFAGRQE